MTDALKLKKRILKILAIFPKEEIEPKNKDVKFALKITPFEMKNFIVVVEYFHKIDMIRVSASVGIGKNLKENYKKKNEDEKKEILALFNKRIVARNFNVIIAEDFSALDGYKLLFQQDMSAQRLFDTVIEAIFLLQDLGELFYKADQSLKVPKVSQTSYSMFQ